MAVFIFLDLLEADTKRSTKLLLRKLTLVACNADASRFPD